MAAKIRLTRMGRKKRPFYRIVVTDSRMPRDGRYIESIGTYDPVLDPPEVKIVEEKANYWLDHGAIPTGTVKSLFRHQGIIYKRYLKRKGFEEAKIDEEMKKWEVLQIERQRRRAAEKQAKKKKKAEEAESEKAESEVSNEKIENKAEEINNVEIKDKEKEEKVDKEEDKGEGKSTDEQSSL